MSANGKHVRSLCSHIADNLHKFVKALLFFKHFQKIVSKPALLQPLSRLLLFDGKNNTNVSIEVVNTTVFPKKICPLFPPCYVHRAYITYYTHRSIWETLKYVIMLSSFPLRSSLRLLCDSPRRRLYQKSAF